MSHAFVVLSTCNGERFLVDQIDSLIGQSHSEWTLLVRDDGSTDRTPSIIERCERRDSRIRRLIDDDGRLGAAQSFGRLLEAAAGLGADRVFLCDQDDVWAPDKMDRQIARLDDAEQRFGSDTALIVHSDLEVVDERLAQLRPSFMASQRLRHVSTHPLATLAVQNFVTGCTILANRAALDVALPIPAEAVMHDWWMALCVAGTGRILFDPIPIVKYRQHRSNAIGAQGYWGTIWNSLRRRVRLDSHFLREDSDEFEAVLRQAGAAADRLAEFHPPSARWMAEFVDLWRRPSLPGRKLSVLRRLKSRRLDPLRHLLLQTRLAFAGDQR